MALHDARKVIKEQYPGSLVVGPAGSRVAIQEIVDFVE